MDDGHSQKGGSSPRAISPEWSLISFVLAAFIVFASMVVAASVGYRIDQSNRANLLTRVETIAYLSNADALASLSGTLDDISSDAYQNTKNALYRLRTINSDSRFVYFMRSNGTQLFFLVDSERPSSKDYSPPGQVYTDTSPLELYNYNNQVSFTEGPYSDHWGTWVSGYAPVYTSDHTFVGIVGMDIDATHWQSEITSTSISIISVGLALGAVFLLLGFYLRRSLAAVRESEQKNESLRKEKESVNGLVERARIGVWTFTPNSGAVSFNDVMFGFTNIERKKSLTIEMFLSAMNLESRKNFEQSLANATAKTLREFSLNITFFNGTCVHLSADIAYGSGLVPVRISGIAQEVQQK